MGGGFPVEAVLEVAGGGVGFDHADDFGKFFHAFFHDVLAEFRVGVFGVAGVVVGVFGVPPDAGVGSGQGQAVEVFTRVGGGAVYVRQVWSDVSHLGGFHFIGMTAGGGFSHGPDPEVGLGIQLGIEEINEIVPFRFQLGLAEILDQVGVAAVAVDQQDFFEAVAGYFAAGLVEQAEKQLGTVRNGSRLVARLKDLAGVPKGENHGVLGAGGQQRKFAGNENICAERQVLPMLFHHAHGEDAEALREVGGFDKICRGEFFPRY